MKAAPASGAQAPWRAGAAGRRALAAAGFCIGLGAGTGAAAPVHAEPVVYRLDPQFSFVHFEVLHFGTSTMRGRVGPIDGSVTLDAAAGRGELGLTIDVASVSTGFRLFDARLREPDLLDTANYPTAWYVARQFRFGAGGALEEVNGELTLRGVSQGLRLKALGFACRHDAERAREVCGGDFEGELDRSSIGASFGLPFVSDQVRLRVQVEGLRDP